MCDCTHHEASSASTNTREPNKQASANCFSCADENSNHPQLSGSFSKHFDLKLKTELAIDDNNADFLLNFGQSMDTSADSVEFLQLTIGEEGLPLYENTLLRSSFKPGEDVSIAVFDGVAVITTDPQKQALIKSSQELQLRQDELKEDFSYGIVQLLEALFKSVLEEMYFKEKSSNQAKNKGEQNGKNLALRAALGSVT